MTRGLVDTSVFVALEAGRTVDRSSLPVEMAVSIVTAAELQAGVLAAEGIRERTRRLGTLTLALDLDPLPVDDRVAFAWADLRAELRSVGRRMPINDSWIAATAIAHGLPLVTQDQDYVDVPGLEIILV